MIVSGAAAMEQYHAIGRRSPGRGRGRVPAAAPSGSTFSPLDLASLELWLKAESGDITIATGVSQWDDRSGNARHFVQATGSAQPTFSELLGRVVFDGTNDVLTNATALSDIIAADAYAVFGKLSWVTIGTAAANAYDDDSAIADSGGYWGYHADSTTPTAIGYHTDGLVRVAPKAVTLDTPYVGAWWLDSGTMSHSVNGGSAATQAAGNVFSLTGTLRLGQNYSTVFANVAIYELFVCSSALTSDERDDAIAYLMAA